MKKAQKFSRVLIVSAILAVFFAISLCSCTRESVKNDVEITFVDMNGAAVTDTQITVSGITDMDIAEQKTTDGEGKSSSKILKRANLPFIYTAAKPLSARHIRLPTRTLNAEIYRFSLKITLFHKNFKVKLSAAAKT